MSLTVAHINRDLITTDKDQVKELARKLVAKWRAKDDAEAERMFFEQESKEEKDPSFFQSLNQ